MRKPASILMVTAASMLASVVYAQDTNRGTHLAGSQRVLHQPASSVSRTAQSASPTRQVNYVEPIHVDSYNQIDCEPTCTPTAAWISAEWLYWSTKGVDFPALATSSPSSADQTVAGVLPTSITQFGNEEFHDDTRSGGRFSVGGWLDANHTTSVEVSYLELNDTSESFNASANSFPALARPFIDTTTETENARLINFDGLIEGELAIRSTSEFRTYEALLRHSFIYANGSRTGFIIGYRGANLDDMVRIDESTTALTDVVAGTSFVLFDEFDTENEFHGLTLGYEYIGPTIQNGSLEFFGKVALGATSSRATVNGGTNVTTATGDASASSAGFLAQGTNIGTFKEDEFDTISEVGIRMRFHSQYDLDFFVGYSFLYWGEVARAGSQIDRGINVSQIPPGTLVGEERPRPPIERESFWAQGLNVGLSYAF